MNFPALSSPPTDNLYKFMALSGVVLLIIAPFFWAKFYITHAERTQLAIQMLRELPPPGYFDARAAIEGGLRVSAEQKKLVEKYDALRKESSRVGSEFLFYENFRYVVTGAAIFLGLLGCALTYFGFRLWYLRLQKPLDRILKKQAAEPDEDPT